MARARGVYRATPARRAALKKAQLASARKRKRNANIKKAVYVGAAIGVAGYAHREITTVKVYHNTSHHQAKQIHKYGIAPGVGNRRRRGSFGGAVAPRGVAMVGNVGSRRDLADHEVGRIFVAKGRNNARAFGTATVKSRVSRKKFNKFAKIDQHPAVKGYGITNFYQIEHQDVAKIGLKFRYGKGSQLRNRVRVGAHRAIGPIPGRQRVNPRV